MEKGEEITYVSLDDQICDGIVDEVFPIGWNGYNENCECAKLVDGTFICMDLDNGDCANEIKL